MTAQWELCREPLRVTLLRTGAIALGIGAALTLGHGDLARWPMVSLLALWPAFGGHWVEIWFLNWLRPQISDARAVQTVARLAVWFIGGVVLAAGMGLTAVALLGFPQARWEAWARAWWIAGLAFIGIELVVHLALQLRGRPSFYNGRG